MSAIDRSDALPSPLMSFEDTRKSHFEDFLKTTPDQRVEWLGHMLEVMQLAHEARLKAAGASSNSAPPR